jgi:hypothetical protein
MFLLLACVTDGSGGPGARDSTGIPADDTGIVVDPHFDLGEVEPCAVPVAPAWAESQTATAYERPTSDDLQAGEPGGVALVGAEDVYWVRDGGRLLHRRLRDGVAVEVTWASGVAGLSVADLDGDGLDDLLVAGFAPAIAWGAGTDEEAVTLLPPGAESAWVRDLVPADFDGDGDLDLFVAHTGLPVDPDELHPGVVWNEGDRVFSAVEPVEAGAGFWGRPFDATALDLDGNGSPDIFLCNDLGLVAPNRVLLNDGTGTLVPAEDDAGLGVEMNCMGAAWGDVDGGGALDVSLADTFRRYLLLDEGGVFVDEAASRALGSFDAPQMGWGTAIVDTDNDGRADILLGTSEFWVADAAEFPLYLYRQEADGTFTDTEALPRTTASRGVLPVDLNRDGVVDVVAGDAFRSPWILLSQGCTADAWVEVAAPPGSRVIVTAGGESWGALATTEAGYASGGPARVHVGLGATETVDRIDVDIPWSGRVTLTGPVAARRRITVTP